jgi:hypothetical protein
MDDRLRQRVLVVATQLAVEERDRLAALGTFAEIEDLTAEIGDELTRQLARFELTRRAEEMIETGVHACPDCGKEAEVESELEPLILQGQRGEIEYSEPVCKCTRCRVSFFPSGRRTEAASS